MSNIKYGGTIIIGMKKLNNHYEPTGMTDEYFKTYDRDTIQEKVNEFADPPINISLEESIYKNKKFIAIQINEFDLNPIICKRDGKDFKKGAIYSRSYSKIETSEIKSQNELREILNISIEKGVRNYLSSLKRVGFIFPETTEEDDELLFAKQRGES